MVRKMVLASALALLVAGAARADSAYGGTSFEQLVRSSFMMPNRDDNGESKAYRYWYCQATQVGVVTNFDAFGSYDGSRPDGAPSVNTNCFFISSGFKLHRTPTPNDALTGPDSFTPVEIGTGFYFDSMVCFQATDVPQTLVPGEKLLVWLHEVGENDNRLTVSAGYFASEYGSSTKMAQKDYEITGVTVKPNEWHRLTIKLISDITDCGAQAPGLIVYLDRTALKYNGDAGDAGTLIGSLNPTAKSHYGTGGARTLFPSFDRTRTTIASVAFEGTGALDDLYFPTSAPSFAKDTTPFTLKWSANISAIKWKCGDDAEDTRSGLSGQGSVTINLADPAELKITSVTYAYGYARGEWLDAVGDVVAGDSFAAAPFGSGTVVAAPAVFSVNGKSYATFDRVMDDVAGGSVSVKLANDFVWKGDSPAVWLRDAVNVTLDTNGKGIDSESADWPTVFVEDGSLLLRNSQSADSVVSGGIHDMMVYVSDGKLTVGDTGAGYVTFDGDVCCDSYTHGSEPPIVLTKGKFKDGYGKWEYDQPGSERRGSGQLQSNSLPAPAPSSIGFYLADFIAEGSIVIDVSNGYVTVAPAPEPEDDDCASGVSSDFNLSGKSCRVTLTNTDPKKWYRLFYKDSLTDAEWIPAGEWVRGGETGVVELDAPKGTGPSRFYTLSVSDEEPAP